ncbi:MAG: hypoxanthine phosphoribosyltransferase [Candidatus Adiutrix sp.]
MLEKKLLFSENDIKLKITTLSAQIEADYKKILSPGEQLLVVGVLNGAFIFMADLVRALGDLPVEVDFIRLSSYQDKDTSSAEVVMTKNLEKEIKGRHVLIVEDIADCGLTLSWLMDFLKKRNPASLKVAVAIDKRGRRETSVNLDYVAFSLETGFLVGYGLDYAEKYRNLPSIYHISTRP